MNTADCQDQEAMASVPPVDGPLSGIRVVDFCWAIAGAVSTGMLAAFGAEVIRIESADAVDFNREMPPFAKGDGWRGDRAGFFANVGNATKLGIRLNIKHPRFREVTDALVRRCDIVTENFPGGRMAKYGLDYDSLRQIRPDLIMMSASMYGQTGPWAELRGNGVALLSQSGLSQITGWPDGSARHPGFVYSDFFVPKLVMLAVVAALDHRRRTGIGQYLDVAQLEIATGFVAPALAASHANGTELMREGNRAPWAAPAGVYPCLGSRRWCAIEIHDDREWDALCQVVDRPWCRDPRFADQDARMLHHDELDRQLAAFTRDRDADELMTTLQAYGVPAGRVSDGEELLDDPQLRSRGYFSTIRHSALGKFTYGGLPAAMSRTPWSLRASPRLGEHTEYVCRSLLGFDEAHFADLQEDGVFK